MKFLNRIKTFLFTVLISIFCFCIFFFVSQFFRIKKIEVVSDKKFTLANKNLLVNKNLIFLNKEKVAEQIVQENYLIEKAIVEKVWPSTLKINIYLYKPVASLIVNQGYFNLSFDGRILSKKNTIEPLLPIINYYQKLNTGSFQTGDWINFKDIQQTLFFIDILKQINLPPLTIDIKGQDMLVFKLIDDKEIVFSNNKDKKVHVYQLELIIKQFKIEGKEFKKIDLRFDKPIIEF